MGKNKFWALMFLGCLTILSSCGGGGGSPIRGGGNGGGDGDGNGGGGVNNFTEAQVDTVIAELNGLRIESISELSSLVPAE